MADSARSVDGNEASTTARPLGRILLDQGVVNAETLEEALGRAKATSTRIGNILIDMGAVLPDDVARAVAVQEGVPFLSAEELPSTPPTLKNLSPKYLRQYVACPVAVEGSVVTVAAADPTNPLLLDDLRQTLGLTVKLSSHRAGDPRGH